MLDPLNTTTNSIMLDPTIPGEVEKYIKQLKNGVPAGAGDLRPTLIKYVALIISLPLSHLYRPVYSKMN